MRRGLRGADNLPVTDRLARQYVNLPVTPELTRDEVNYMIDTIEEPAKQYVDVRATMQPLAQNTLAHPALL